jgi:hypothetical protein
MVQDETMGILYTRSEKGTIQVYDLGHDGQAMTRVAASTRAQLSSRLPTLPERWIDPVSSLWFASPQ